MNGLPGICEVQVTGGEIPVQVIWIMCNNYKNIDAHHLPGVNTGFWKGGGV